MEDVIEFKGGKQVVVQKKVFPGYLLVRCELDDDSWYVVRNTPGVTGFVGLGAKPTPLSRKEVEIDPPGPVEGTEASTRKTRPRLEYEVGETVRVTRGPVRRLQRHDHRDQRGPAQAQGARQHLRPGDPGRARVRQALTAQLSAGQWHPSGTGSPPRPTESTMAKKQSPQSSSSRSRPGKATPAPPVGTALGPHGVNIMEFCKQYNAATESQRGHGDPRRDHDLRGPFVHLHPQDARRRRCSCAQAAGLDKGSRQPDREKVGSLTDGAGRRDRRDEDARPQRQRPRGRQAPGRRHRPLHGDRGRLAD